jgi:multiple sugar transport system substrate-binding protein
MNHQSRVLVVFLIVALLAGCVGIAPAEPAAPAVEQPVAAKQPAAEPAGFNWRAYEGRTIRFLANKHPWTSAIESSIPQFEKETGIKVNLEVLPEDQFRQKVLVELTTGAGTVDVFMSMPPQEGLKYHQAGWYEPLNSYLENPNLTSPDYDAADFLAGVMGAETIEGDIIGIPIMMENEVLYYRKDIFEEEGIAVPTTFEELEAVAKRLHDPDQDFYGFVARGKGAAAVTQFSTFLYNMGGDWLDENRVPTLNTPEAVAALDFYGRLLRECGPPGATNFHWYEASSLLAQGKVAMYTDANSLFSVVEDPESSTVVGKIGYAMMPAGPAGNHPYVSVWGISMASNSENKEPSWYLMQWLTSKDMVKAAQMQGVPGGRRSVWEDAEGAKAFPEDWVETFVKSNEIAFPYDRPPVVAVSEVRDAIGKAIVISIEGGDVALAAQQANIEMADIMSRTE